MDKKNLPTFKPFRKPPPKPKKKRAIVASCVVIVLLGLSGAVRAIARADDRP